MSMGYKLFAGLLCGGSTMVLVRYFDAPAWAGLAVGAIILNIVIWSGDLE